MSDIERALKTIDRWSRHLDKLQPETVGDAYDLEMHRDDLENLRGVVQTARQAPASGEVVDEKGSLPWFCRVYNSGYHAGHHDTVEGGYAHVYPQDMDDYHEEVVMEILEDLQQEAYTHPPVKVPEGCQHENTYKTGLGYIVCYQCQKSWHPDDELPSHLQHMRSSRG